MKMFLSMLLILALSGAAEAQTKPIQRESDGKILRFYDYAKFKAVRQAAPGKIFSAAKLPPVAIPFDWGKTLPMPMLGNDQAGDCFYASACHHDTLLTGNAGTPQLFDERLVLKNYYRLSGGDNGLSDGDIINEWTGRGLADVADAKIIDTLYLDINDPKAVQSAMYWFVGVQFTFTVPSRWINNSDTGAEWDIPCPANNNGHAVMFGGVDAQERAKLYTWGTYVWLTKNGLKACDPSGFVVFSKRAFNPKGYLPNGKHITEAAKMWVEAGGDTIPQSVINSFPPPGDNPPPPTPGKDSVTIIVSQDGKTTTTVIPLVSGGSIVWPVDTPQWLKDAIERQKKGLAPIPQAETKKMTRIQPSEDDKDILRLLDDRITTLGRKQIEGEQVTARLLTIVEGLQAVIGAAPKKEEKTADQPMQP